MPEQGQGKQLVQRDKGCLQIWETIGKFTLQGMGSAVGRRKLCPLHVLMAGGHGESTSTPDTVAASPR